MLGGRSGLAKAIGESKYADLQLAMSLSVLIRHFTRVIEQLASSTPRPSTSKDA